MIWQNPWAWLGLLLVAVPIIVHLLARRSARVQPFPSLRFLQSTPPLATRRARITDPLLLAVRSAIVLAAVAALAQPLWLTEERDAAAARALARAIIVDTSASVVDAPAARAAAAADAAAASASVVMETAAPGELLAGAAAWLETRRERGEIIVYSDFQLNAVDSVHIGGVPANVGLTLRRLSAPRSDSALERTMRNVALRVDLAGNVYSWTNTATDTALHDVVVIGDSLARAGAAASMRAADVRGAASIRRPIALVFDDSVRVAARAFTQPWMAEAAAALRSELAPDSFDGDTAGVPSPWLRITTDVAAAAGEVAGEERMLLRVRTDAASVTMAALIGALGRATSADAAISELEPRTLADAQLAAWQRAPSSARVAAPLDASDGRWLWVLVLLLLLGETILRRRTVQAA